MDVNLARSAFTLRDGVDVTIPSTQCIRCIGRSRLCGVLILSMATDRRYC